MDEMVFDHNQLKQLKDYQIHVDEANYFQLLPNLYFIFGIIENNILLFLKYIITYIFRIFN